LIKEKNLLISVNSEQFLHIVFLGLAASAGGFLFYIYALKNLGVVATTLFVNFIPVTTMLTGRIFLNEHLTSLQWIGGFIIVISLYTGSILSSKNSVKTVPKDSKTG
jgi:drug/metabolite transporter (DMT)-like permease